MNVRIFTQNAYLCNQNIKASVMTWVDFIKEYPDEESCKSKFEE